MAARFKFRLEALLKLRHSLEEQAQRDLARTLALQEQAQATLAQYRAAHAAAVAGRVQGMHQEVDLQFWAATDRFLLVTERRLILAAQELNAAQAQVAAARAQLVKAHQDHLMLVRLKERRLELHNLELQRTENRELDEIAVLRYRLNPAGPT